MKGLSVKMVRTMLVAMTSMMLAAPSLAELIKLEKVDFASLPGDRFQVLFEFSERPPEVTGYTIENPARIVLDLPGVESTLDQKKYALAFENARSAVILSAGERTRVVFNLLDLAPYNSRVEGNQLIVDIGSSQATGAVAQSSSASSTPDYVAAAPSAPTTADSSAVSVTNIDFHRGTDGEGLITVDLNDPKVNVDIDNRAGTIVLKLYQTALPEKLDRRLDVVDFATPVQIIDSSADGSTVTINIKASGEYDYLAYQADNQFVVSVKPLTQAELEEKRDKFAFTGEKLSLNFQDIEVRSVLQLVADFTGLNLVASDTVAGSITLRLENVPWDQALDIILKAKGLDKRQQGNVMMVAPAAEIAEQERLQVEANKQLEELAPLRTEFIRIRYADAKELFELFDDEDEGSGGNSGDRTATSSILSERGTAIVDERTNTIILTDTEEKIAEFRRLVREIDIPIKQVVIESRIVIANTDFREELGVQWGVAGVGSFNGNQIGASGRREGFAGSGDDSDSGIGGSGGSSANGFGNGGLFGDGSIRLQDVLSVDAGINEPTGSLALAFLSDNIFLDLELNALEDSGRGEIVSQPKVITGDKQEASIETGTEIPFLEATSSGAASLTFKEAVLKLEVTPQITPDNRIIMDLFISQDSVGAEVPGLFGSLVPTIDITRVQTQALVGNGQTIVLGGIFQLEELERVEKVPVLGDIPYVGRLFRNDIQDTKKREILIFITPKIINDALLDQ